MLLRQQVRVPISTLSVLASVAQRYRVISMCSVSTALRRGLLQLAAFHAEAVTAVGAEYCRRSAAPRRGGLNDHRSVGENLLSLGAGVAR